MKKILTILMLSIISMTSNAATHNFYSVQQAVDYLGIQPGQKRGFGSAIVSLDYMWYINYTNQQPGVSYALCNVTSYCYWIQNNPLPVNGGGKWNRAVLDDYNNITTQMFVFNLPTVRMADQFCQTMGGSLVATVSKVYWDLFIGPMAKDAAKGSNIYVDLYAFPSNPVSRNYKLYTRTTYRNDEDIFITEDEVFEDYGNTGFPKRTFPQPVVSKMHMFYKSTGLVAYPYGRDLVYGVVPICQWRANPWR